MPNTSRNSTYRPFRPCTTATNRTNRENQTRWQCTHPQTHKRTHTRATQMPLPTCRWFPWSCHVEKGAEGGANVTRPHPSRPFHLFLWPLIDCIGVSRVRNGDALRPSFHHAVHERVKDTGVWSTTFNDIVTNTRRL